MLIQERTVKRFGYKPDLGDPRDQSYTVGKAITLPDKVDLRLSMPPVWNQGHLGSCVAHAVPALLCHLVPGLMPSRLWVYYKTRSLECSVKDDSGCELRDAIKVLSKLGCPPESVWPYAPDKFAIAPPKSVNDKAKGELIAGYYRLNDLHDMLDCLARGFPFATGITVFESIQSAEVARTGTLPLPTNSDSPIGGHAIAVVGYDMATKRFLVRNSWGAAWGDGGHLTVPFDYLASNDLCSDSWMVTKQQGTAV
jgi:C1A family cysteine protease